MTAKVNQDNCVGCAACIEVCPVDAITVNVVATIDPKKCRSCGVCVDNCPQFTIEMD